MRRPRPVWAPPERPQSGLPVDVLITATVVAGVGFVVFGLRRGTFWLPMVTASLAMLAITMSRTPRHQDLLKVHDGIVVLGVGSAFALFLAFVLLGPVVRRVHPLSVAVLKAYSRPATLRTATAFVVLLLIAPAEEAFWRGFVQGRLSQDYGESRAFRLTLAGYVASYLVTLNLALAGAALICGGCWGWFRLRTGSIVPSILSHTLFTLVVYFAYPL